MSKIRLGRCDSFIIGLCLAFSITNLFNKEYIGIAIQGFILGLYFGVGFIISKFPEGENQE